MEIEVEELTTRPVPAVVPNFTTVAPVKPVPVTVTGVPPVIGPEVGFTTVNAPGSVAISSLAPHAAVAMLIEIEVEELTTRPVPAVVPNFTTVAPAKPVPVTVTGVPPVVGPVLGLTPVAVGTGGAVKVN